MKLGLTSNEFNKIKESINGFSEIRKTDWFKDVPNKSAIANALSVLDLFIHVGKIPENVSVSPEGSILFSFYNGNDFYIIEIYNTGEIVYLKRPQGKDSIANEVSFDKLKSNLNEDFEETVS